MSRLYSAKFSGKEGELTSHEQKILWVTNTLRNHLPTREFNRLVACARESIQSDEATQQLIMEAIFKIVKSYAKKKGWKKKTVLEEVVTDQKVDRLLETV